MNVQAIIDLAREPVIKENVAQTIYHLNPDPWFWKGICWHAWGYRAKEIWFSAWTFLLAFARLTKPKVYLETGVRKGGSMSLILSQSPETFCYGFDAWPPDYAKIDGWKHVPATPELVRQQIQQWGDPKVELISGDSKKTYPQWRRDHPGVRASLAFVDGEHSDEGARSDLNEAFQMADVVLFDDIVHPSHPFLRKSWDDTYARFAKEYPLQYLDTWNVGTAIAFHRNCLVADQK